jgi:hypothetical protein
MAADGDIRIELDGPGVKPETVAARTLLDVASAFLDVVERLAAADAEEVTFRGLRVEAKCVAIVTNLEPARFARPLADQARALAETTAPPPARSRYLREATA